MHCCIGLPYILEIKYVYFPENSSSSIKITIDGVVDSDAQLKKLENALDELSVESEMKVKSVERNCIELVVEIDNCYFKDKQKLLQAVLKFFTCLQEKQAFKWKGNKVTIVITIDEGNLFLKYFILYHLGF